ncbi:MAG: hypothetical protein GXP42_13440 [Chloroflexi bacterium]|nr:hypothetical protein [Chloroflexota bacterium]
MLTSIAIIAALVALGLALSTRRQLQEVNRRLSRASSHIYELLASLETLEERLETQGKELRFEIKNATGQVRFGPETTIREVQAVHPLADRIMAAFHMGGCHSCAVSPDETIAEACTRLGVDQAAFLAALQNQDVEPIPLINIQLQ